MSLKQREDLDQLLREGRSILAGSSPSSARSLEEMMASVPLAGDIEATDFDRGGIPAVLIETDASKADRAVHYLHGGAHALGSARGGVGLASEVAGRWHAVPSR